MTRAHLSTQRKPPSDAFFNIRKVPVEILPLFGLVSIISVGAVGAIVIHCTSFAAICGRETDF